MWRCIHFKMWSNFFEAKDGPFLALKNILVSVLGKRSFTKFPHLQSGSAVVFMFVCFCSDSQSSWDPQYWVIEDEAREIRSEILSELSDILPGLKEHLSSWNCLHPFKTWLEFYLPGSQFWIYILHLWNEIFTMSILSSYILRQDYICLSLIVLLFIQIFAFSSQYTCYSPMLECSLWDQRGSPQSI